MRTFRPKIHNTANNALPSNRAAMIDWICDRGGYPREKISLLSTKRLRQMATRCGFRGTAILPQGGLDHHTKL